ncbi:GNAT-like acetyltransferase domain containing protein, partial [Euroglyphus maynei]
MATTMVNHHNNDNNHRNSDLDFKLTIRHMKLDEIEPSVMIFSRADLNDSLNVVESFYESDPSGFFVAVDEDSDQVIGACAAPMTTHQTRFLGLYCVEPKFQGYGIG